MIRKHFHALPRQRFCPALVEQDIDLCASKAFILWPWILNVVTLFCRYGDSNTQIEWKLLSSHTHRRDWICFSKRNIFSTFSGPTEDCEGRFWRVQVGDLSHRVCWNITARPVKPQHLLVLSGSSPSSLVSFTLWGALGAATGHFKLDEGETSGAEGPASVPRRRNLDRHATGPMSSREKGETPHTGPSTSHLSTSECPAHRRVSVRHTPGVGVHTLDLLKCHTATREDTRGRLTRGSEVPVTSLSSLYLSRV